MEPVAAAHYYESTLERDELILIGDFGGGTSDFSLIHVGPTIRRRGRTAGDLLGTAGVAIAGDAFDAKIVRNLVSPYLGAGTQMRSMNKILPVPTWVYAKLERWHHLSFLKARDTMNMLASVKAQALEPHKIEALIHLVNEDLGYHLHQAVQKTKALFRWRRRALPALRWLPRGGRSRAAVLLRKLDCGGGGRHRRLRGFAAQELRRSAGGREYGVSHRRLVVCSRGSPGV